MGETLNLMSLGGLAVAVGLVIDDAVVIVEAVHRHLEEGLPPAEAARRGTEELLWPVVGTTATTVVVFLPLGLLSGVAGQFFAALSISLSVAVVLSLPVALGVLPSLAARWLRPVRRASAGARLSGKYGSALQRALARPGLVLILALVLTAAGARAGRAAADRFLARGRRRQLRGGLLRSGRRIARRRGCARLAPRGRLARHAGGGRLRPPPGNRIGAARRHAALARRHRGAAQGRTQARLRGDRGRSARQDGGARARPAHRVRAGARRHAGRPAGLARAGGDPPLRARRGGAAEAGSRRCRAHPRRRGAGRPIRGRRRLRARAEPARPARAGGTAGPLCARDRRAGGRRVHRRGGLAVAAARPPGAGPGARAATHRRRAARPGDPRARHALVRLRRAVAAARGGGAGAGLPARDLAAPQPAQHGAPHGAPLGHQPRRGGAGGARQARGLAAPGRVFVGAGRALPAATGKLPLAPPGAGAGAGRGGGGAALPAQELGALALRAPGGALGARRRRGDALRHRDGAQRLLDDGRHPPRRPGGEERHPPARPRALGRRRRARPSTMRCWPPAARACGPSS